MIKHLDPKWIPRLKHGMLVTLPDSVTGAVRPGPLKACRVRSDFQLYVTLPARDQGWRHIIVSWQEHQEGQDYTTDPFTKHEYAVATQRALMGLIMALWREGAIS